MFPAHCRHKDRKDLSPGGFRADRTGAALDWVDLAGVRSFQSGLQVASQVVRNKRPVFKLLLLLIKVK